MSRWINAEWLLGVTKLSNGTVDIDDIYNAPSIELVRCRECVYRNNRKKCPMRVFTGDNGFCSYGEWMKGADDYERAIEQMEHYMLYEPTYNAEDGSM